MISSKFLSFFCFAASVQVILASTPAAWTLLTVDTSRSRASYTDPRACIENSPESLVAIINPAELVARHGDVASSEVIEYLIIDRMHFMTSLSSASAATTTGSKKGKGKKAGAAEIPATVVDYENLSLLTTELVQSHIEALYEDYTAAHFVKHLPAFLSSFSGRLFKIVPEGKTLDSELFDSIKAFKLTFKEGKFVISSYLVFDATQDENFAIRFNFSNQMSSLFLYFCETLNEQTMKGWSAIMAHLASQSTSADSVEETSGLSAGKARKGGKSASRDSGAGGGPVVSSSEQKQPKKAAGGGESKAKSQPEPVVEDPAIARQRETEAERQREIEAEKKRIAEIEAEKKRLADLEAEAERQRKAAEAEAERQRKAEIERKERAERQRQAQEEADRKRQIEINAEREREAAAKALKKLQAAEKAEAKLRADAEAKEQREAKRNAEIQRKAEAEAEQLRKEAEQKAERQRQRQAEAEQRRADAEQRKAEAERRKAEAEQKAGGGAKKAAGPQRSLKVVHATPNVDEEFRQKQIAALEQKRLETQKAAALQQQQQRDMQMQKRQEKEARRLKEAARIEKEKLQEEERIREERLAQAQLAEAERIEKARTATVVPEAELTQKASEASTLSDTDLSEIERKRIMDEYVQKVLNEERAANEERMAAERATFEQKIKADREEYERKLKIAEAQSKPQSTPSPIGSGRSVQFSPSGNVIASQSPGRSDESTIQQAYVDGFSFGSQPNFQVANQQFHSQMAPRQVYYSSPPPSASSRNVVQAPLAVDTSYFADMHLSNTQGSRSSHGSSHGSQHWHSPASEAASSRSGYGSARSQDSQYYRDVYGNVLPQQPVYEGLVTGARHDDRYAPQGYPGFSGAARQEFSSSVPLYAPRQEFISPPPPGLIPRERDHRFPIEQSIVPPPPGIAQQPLMRQAPSQISGPTYSYPFDISPRQRQGPAQPAPAVDASLSALLPGLFTRSPEDQEQEQDLYKLF